MTSSIPTQDVADIVQLACRAPSFHNSQPWRVEADGAGRLRVHLDHDRLVATDSSGREALLSCGALLDHVRVAAAAGGWVAAVEYCLDPDDFTHLATVDFSRQPVVADIELRHADAILERRTDRLPFAAPSEWSQLEPLLRDAVTEDMAWLDVLPDEVRPQLAEASQLTESLRLYDSSYHAELDWWTASFETVDGIPHSALVTAAESDRVDIGRSFPVTHRPERRAQVAEDGSKVLVLSSLGDTRRDILACGEAMSRALLQATALGLATCPLTHLTEVAASRDIVSELTGRAMPQVLIRVGLAPVLGELAPPTPRRPLDDVLSWHVDRTAGTLK